MSGTAGAKRPQRTPQRGAVQIKGRLPRASADLFLWAVDVTAVTTRNRGAEGPPSQNACTVAALETWAEQVLLANPDVAEATARARFGAQDDDDADTIAARAALLDLLHELGLNHLIPAIEPEAADLRDDADPRGPVNDRTGPPGRRRGEAG